MLRAGVCFGCWGPKGGGAQHCSLVPGRDSTREPVVILGSWEREGSTRRPSLSCPLPLDKTPMGFPTTKSWG